MTDTRDELSAYLCDHQAGSVAARGMLQHAIAHNTNSDRGFFLALDRDIADDQQALVHLIERLGTHPSPAKSASAWLAEKFTRLKLSLTHGMLGRLELLEALMLGVQGKLALWKNLSTLSADDPLIADIDLPTLIERANDQIMRIEVRRRAAFRRLVAPDLAFAH